MSLWANQGNTDVPSEARNFYIYANLDELRNRKKLEFAGLTGHTRFRTDNAVFSDIVETRATLFNLKNYFLQFRIANKLPIIIKHNEIGSGTMQADVTSAIIVQFEYLSPVIPNPYMD